MNKPSIPNRSRRMTLLKPGKATTDTALAKLIVTKRKELNISQADLSVSINRTQPWLSNVEQSTTWNITALDIINLAKALKLEPAAVLTAIEETAVTCGHGVANMIPEEGSGQQARIVNGQMVIEPVLNLDLVEASALTPRVEPNFRWEGVEFVPIDPSQLPMVPEGALDEPEDGDWDKGL